MILFYFAAKMPLKAIGEGQFVILNFDFDLTLKHVFCLKAS